MRRLYDDLVVPALVHWGMQSQQLASWRMRTVAGAYGRVLEIGIGSGFNFPHYSREVREVVGVDPSSELLRRAAKAGGWMPFKIRLMCQSAEGLPFPDASFDCVVATWALCSIPDAAAALAEAHRVLRPNGLFLFIEHGAAMHEPGLERWQQRLTPAWRLIAGGCHLDRRPDRLLEQAGFALQSLEAGHLIKGPRLVTYQYQGSAKPQ